MADWKKALKEIILADGKLDKTEAKVLKKAVMADGVVDDDEVDFLVELRNKARKTSPEFDKFFFDALKNNILADGVITADETKRLRKIVMADGKVDKNEKAFLKALQKGAFRADPAFDKLCAECL